MINAPFFLTGHVIKGNIRYWSDKNVHIIRVKHTQKHQKIFFRETLIGEAYLNMLENIDLLVPQQVENQLDAGGKEPLDEHQLFFRQNSVPPFYAAKVCDWLNQRQPNHWVGRRGAIEWSSRLQI